MYSLEGCGFVCVATCVHVQAFWRFFCWISLISFSLVKVPETLCCSFASPNNQFICILLLFESLYPALQHCCAGLKASLCQHFLLCDPNLVHKIICKYSVPIHYGNREIVQINHDYSATRVYFFFFRCETFSRVSCIRRNKL